MTIQVTVANAYGVAMASDRHVYRHGQTLSTGRQSKLQILRGPIPAAMMSAGSFSLVGFPLSRLALQIERALQSPAEGGPDGLAHAVLSVLQRPLEVQGGADEVARRDTEALARAAELVVGRALTYGDSRRGIEKLLEEIRQAPRCEGGEAVEELGRSAWQSAVAELPRLLATPGIADVVRHTPDLLGEATINALVRDWNRPADASVMVGLCCQETGVPAAVAVNIWKGLGNRLLFAPRHDRAHYALHRAGRSLLLSQGSGRSNLSAMVEGIAPAHATACRDRETIAPAIERRWQRAHERIAVSSPGELVGIATGLVRGAEVIGYLTGDDEGSIADIDAVLLTPGGAVAHTMAGATI